MASRWSWHIGRVRQKSSWVSQEISHFSHARDVVVSDLEAENGRYRGRRARSDQIASCLLHHGLPHSAPLRQRDRLQRNRRGVVVVATLTLAWWVCGHMMG